MMEEQLFLIAVDTGFNQSFVLSAFVVRHLLWARIFLELIKSTFKYCFT